MTCQHPQVVDGVLRYRLNACRMVLAWLNDYRLHDHDSAQVFNMIAAEIGDCPGCWRRIAEYAAGLAMEYLTGRIAVQDGCGDEEANAEKAAAVIERRIARGLEQ